MYKLDDILTKNHVFKKGKSYVQGATLELTTNIFNESIEYCLPFMLFSARDIGLNYSLNWHVRLGYCCQISFVVELTISLISD